MTRCRACGAPIRYAAEDLRRRFPLDRDNLIHICMYPRALTPEEIASGCKVAERLGLLPRVREQHKVREGA
jgi:hypothetical protein